jgi:CHASE2 domain-containing sensor protein
MPALGRARRLVAPAATCIALLICGVLALSGALDSAEHATVDRRFDLRETQPSPEVAVVAIDDASIQAIGAWPFDRIWHARAVDRLREAGVKLIVYDVQFTEPSPKPKSDLALYRALERAGGGVLAATTSDPRGRTTVLGGDANLRAIGAEAGATNAPTDRAAVIRRYVRSVGRLQSLPVVAAERAGRAPGPDDFRDDGSAYIDFRGPPGAIRTVRFVDLVEGRVEPSLLRDRIVVVGATAPSLQDVHPTSSSGSAVMSGPEIEANAIWTALHGNPLRDGPGGLGVLAFAVLGLAPLALMRRRPAVGLLGAIVVGALYLAVAVLTFNAGTILPVVAPLLALAGASIAILAASYVAVVAQRAMQARVSEQLREEIEARTAELRDTQLEIVHRLAQAAERRDDETGAHLERIGEMTEKLALAAGMTPTEAGLVRHASAMHDVGKIGIPDSVLHKPGPLTEQEWKIMRTHPLLGARILSNSNAELVQLAEQIARTHHERWDGSGYPAGLAGEQIPLAGRICAVCDVFDALVSWRPYKHAWPPADALDEIRRQRGLHFDPRLADLFVELVERGEISRPQKEPPVPAT